MKRRDVEAHILLMLVVSIGCSSTKKDTIEPDEPAPFIKLAKRELGLVLHWLGSPAPPQYQQDLERLLARHFKTTYRTPVFSHRQEGKYEGLSPNLLLDLVENGVDDVVVVEVEQKGKRDGPMHGTVRIISLGMQKLIHKFPIPELKSKRSGRPTAPRFADFVWLRVRREWTDPGSSPELDPLLAADRFADRKACAHAIRIYDRLFDSWKPKTVNELKRLADSKSRRRKCQGIVEVNEAILKDKGAVFRLNVDVSTQEAVKTAFLASIKESKIDKLLRRFTNKPVRIEITPGDVVLHLRYHPDRYKKAIGKKPRMDGSSRLVHLDYWRPVMHAITDLRERTKEKLIGLEGTGINKVQTRLFLSKLGNTYVAIDFVELDERVLLTDHVRVKYFAPAEVAVKSGNSRETIRNLRFYLGPSETEGKLSKAGLLYKFFELDGYGNAPE